MSVPAESNLSRHTFLLSPMRTHSPVSVSAIASFLLTPCPVIQKVICIIWIRIIGVHTKSASFFRGGECHAKKPAAHALHLVKNEAYCKNMPATVLFTAPKLWKKIIFYTDDSGSLCEKVPYWTVNNKVTRCGTDRTRNWLTWNYCDTEFTPSRQKEKHSKGLTKRLIACNGNSAGLKAFFFRFNHLKSHHLINQSEK